MSRVIVICGPPCAGKSTLARQLEGILGWPLLAKDAYKERVFDALGVGDRDWSRRVSLLAWQMLFAEAAHLVAVGADCLLEGNFRPAQAGALEGLAAEGAELLELCCSAPRAVLLERYRARALEGRRHPGHVDAEAFAGIEHELVAEPPALLPAAAPRVVVATDSARPVTALAAELLGRFGRSPPR